MRILSRKDFLKCKKGTVFAKVSDVVGIFDDLSILTDTTQYDFLSVSLSKLFPKRKVGEYLDSWMGLDNGEEIEMELASTRDGLFEEKDKFAVYSKNEVQEIIEALQEALELINNE